MCVFYTRDISPKFIFFIFNNYDFFCISILNVIFVGYWEFQIGVPLAKTK